MSATALSPEFDRNLQPRERRFPRLSLRRRASEHPMVMFAILAAAALSSMAFVPTAGPAFASFGAPVKLDEDVRTTAKLARIPFTEADIACRGQAWGAETKDCLLTIAKVSGVDADRRVRTIASAEPLKGTPNIY